MSESGTDLSHIAANHAIAFIDVLPGPDLAHRRLVAYSKWIERHPARVSSKRAWREMGLGIRDHQLHD
jgi:hypothetical protein